MGTAFYVLKKNHKSLNGQFNSQIITVLSLLFICTKIAYAEDVSKPDTAPCDPWAAQIAALEGRAEIQSPKQAQWRSVKTGDYLCPGDRLKILDSRAALLLPNETVVRLNEATTIHFMPPQQPAWMELLQGAVHFITRTPRRFEIKTPYLNAAVEGTEFLLAHDKSSELNVFEGKVSAYNSLGKLKAVSGQGAIAHAGSAPQLVARVNLRNAVQWALYYPPVLPHPAINEPIQAGGINAWRDRLKAIPEAQRDIAYYNSLGSLQLFQGKVDAARESIIQALAKARKDDPNLGNTLALRGIIELIGADTQQALASATSATQLAPKNPAPWLALSYVQQGLFQLPQALASARRSVDLAPDNALAKARLAELTLAQGDYNRAVSIAEHAAQLNPELSRVQMILGYAHLSAFDLTKAKQAFSLAAQRDPSDPMSQLGRGLVSIRSGQLAIGRRQIELATVLDPGNALLRSYLGKAYYEEHRNPLAATQFGMAQSLDPNDPTPWFYDAIRKQTLNRPVEALQDLQKSIQFNDNRAVYRSRLLLDGDLAARSSSLGRIYRDLGFEQLALVEGWKSVNTDPSDYSGHRFLADTYSALPRHEIARVSELLQSQLLQPINITPFQPQLAETNVLILSGAGPSDPSFNEFNPLFTRNRVAFQANGIVGSNDTAGDDLVVSGIRDRLSYSIGQFHFETDGFRENNDLKQDIYNVFVQTAITPWVNVQAEYRRQERDQGDLVLNFDPNMFSRTQRREIDQDTARLGARFALTPQSDIIASLAYGQREAATDIPGVFQSRGDDKAHQVEAQYMFRHDRSNLIVGGGSYEVDSDNSLTIGGMLRKQAFTVEQDSAYVYANIPLLSNLNLATGLSYDSFEAAAIDVNRLSPKGGMQWDISESIRLRLAYIETVKRALVVDQTIEPTQVAGFNQFFDDLNGTMAKRHGLGLDVVFSGNLYGGVELSHRDLEFESIGGGQISERKEDLYRAYLYWIPNRHWAMSVKPEFERFRRPSMDPTVMLGGDPSKVETEFVPVVIKYFNPSGFFAEIGGTFVRQEVDLAPTSTFTGDSDEFFLIEVAVGYRLPKRRGIVSLEVRNLFDEEFRYQDDSIQTADRLNPPRFLPDRTAFVRVTLSF